MEKLWMFIEGSIEVDVDEDTFHDEFIKWVESKGWGFTGMVKPIEEDD